MRYYRGMDAIKKLEELLAEMEPDLKEVVLAHVRNHFVPKATAGIDPPPQGPGGGPDGN